ncbi:MAG TPA: hypothetical protein VFM09_06600 [Marmoricola sp.]|nr:hypothetical protein [Marmoricola sp.]
MRKLQALVAAAALAVTATLTGAVTGGSAQAADTPAKPLTVMTRNLYLGADINRPVQAALAAQAQGESPEEVVTALANATHVTRAIVDHTDFRVRSRLLAAEIARTKPDLVGMQEVALWRSGPVELDPAHLAVPDATHVDYDFLQLLLDALAAQGVVYEPVEIAPRADVEAPSFTGSLVKGTVDFAHAQDVRLTMRDVILMRVGGNDLRLLDSGDATYSHNLQVTIAGRTLSFDRGYNWVDLRNGSQRLRFVNTHTEAFSSDLALAQVQQLTAQATAAHGPTVLVCDCNSDPLDSTVKTSIGDHVPHKAPYDWLVAAGYRDMWLTFAPADQGWTSGLSETVDDPTAAGFDHRIDMVMVHDPGTVPYADRGQVTGTSVSDRDPATGLWPSDHGGVVLRLRGL